MLSPPEPACLLIADITGYTDYLAGVELDHAQDILADLVGTVVGSLRPTFRLAKLEGDAAFAWLAAPAIDGSLLQDVVERTYVAFRRRLRDIAHASRCECNACIRIPNLDLKVVVHHGSVVRQRMAGRDELVGRDVILVHRLLKNRITETTGIAAYAAYTDACTAAMALADPAEQALVEHREEIDVIGQVTLWVRDLEAVWQADQRRPGVAVEPSAAHRIFTYRSPLPPSVTWEYVTSPARRPQWGGMDELREMSPGGRRGAGTINHCVHGRDTIVEEILEWRPFESLTTRSAIPMPGAPRIVMTDALRPLPHGGTEVELRIGRPRPRERAAFEQILAGLEPELAAAVESLVDLLEQEAVRRGSDQLDEPLPEPSRRRFASEPVLAATRTVDSTGARSSE